MEALRILLIKPKPTLPTVLGLDKLQRLEPLELGYIAGAVPEHNVRILDLRTVRFVDRAFNKALLSFKPDVVGFTAYTHESSSVKRYAKITKKKLPSAKIIVGGHHATVVPHDYNIKEIDGIVRGEGCQAFRAFVEAVGKGEKLVGISGVIATGKHYMEPTEWPQVSDPANLPVPRRDLWDYRDYYVVWNAEKMPKFHTIFPPVAMVRTSWGCKMKCSFCIVPYLCGGVHRARPIDSVVDEIESIKADHIYFSDDENFINKDFAMELAEAIEKRGIKKRYFVWTRATTINHYPDLIQKWRDIGLDGAFLGLEFIDNEELKEQKKGSTVAANEEAIERLCSMHIAVHAAFMLRPEYTLEQFQALRDYMHAMPPSSCSVTVISPSPGTPDYEKLEPYLWVDNTYDIYDCMHPLTKTRLPLKQFSKEYALVVRDGTTKPPLSVNRHIAPPADMFRLLYALHCYRKGYKKLYRDFPKELW